MRPLGTRHPAPDIAKVATVTDLAGTNSTALNCDSTNPESPVIVYSSQRNAVAAVLEAGLVHRQRRENSAAYDLRERGSRHAHRRAYAWMASAYAQRMGHPLVGAPIWVGFDVDIMMRMRSPEWYPERRETERVLRLRIPRYELLLSDYDRWSGFVLEGICLDHDPRRRDITPGAHCICTGRRRRASWDGIFELPKDALHWQGVVDRIEPTWLDHIVD